MKYTFLYLMAIGVLLSGCAQVVAPSGGPKDEEAPYVMDSLCLPPNYTTNFLGTQIELKFNEYIRLNDVRNQVLISPPFADDPEFRLKGKKLTILINSPLKENTTYTINFGTSIEDITEGLKAKNLKYVFSTGSAIDSLVYYGKVRDAYSKAPVENCAVMLYANLSDSAPILQKPDYFAKTNAKGDFAINYIKEGTYKAFALIDGNYNYLFDLPDEAIGFQNQAVELTRDTFGKRGDFYLFKEDNERQYVKSYYVQPPGPALFVFNRKLKNPAFETLNIEENRAIEQTEYGVNGDSVWLWLNPLDLDTLLLRVSDDTLFVDTLELDLTKEAKIRPLTWKSNASAQFDIDAPLVITFSQPIVSFNPNDLILWNDSVTIPYRMETPEDKLRKWLFYADWKGGESYQFRRAPGNISGLYSEQTDSVLLEWTVRKPESYGSLTLNLVLPKVYGDEDEVVKDFKFTIELLKGGKVVKTKTAISGGSQINYERLVPGNYAIRILVDLNQNGVWDTGNYLKKLPAEEVFYFDGNIEIRKKWQQKIDWLLD